MDRYKDIQEQVLSVLLPFGVEEIALFGSVARGEETAESDLDILVRFAEPPRRPLSLITWGRLERELEERCGRKVDLVSARGLSRHLRPVVEVEKVVLYVEARCSQNSRDAECREEVTLRPTSNGFLNAPI